jgi:hypothetical protein
MLCLLTEHIDRSESKCIAVARDNRDCGEKHLQHRFLSVGLACSKSVIGTACIAGATAPTPAA